MLMYLKAGDCTQRKEVRRVAEEKESVVVPLVCFFDASFRASGKVGDN